MSYFEALQGVKNCVMTMLKILPRNDSQHSSQALKTWNACVKSDDGRHSIFFTG
jgi:hypothetical protein